MAQSTLEQLFELYRSSGDLGALAQVFDRVAPDLQRLARRLARDPSQADDWVQSTFLTLLERPQSYQSGRPLRPWMMGILVHRASATRRGQSRVQELEVELATDEASPDSRLGAKEFAESVRRAVEELPPRLRSVVEGRLFHEQGSAELSDQLAISPGTLRVRLHRGLERLRQSLPSGIAGFLAVLLLHTRGLGQVRGAVLRTGAKVSGLGERGWSSAQLVGVLASKPGFPLVAGALTLWMVSMLVGEEPDSPEGSQSLAFEEGAVERVNGAGGASPVPVSLEREVLPIATESESSTGEVTLRVLGPDGLPLVGTTASLELEAPGEPLCVLTKQTNKSGELHFDLPGGTRLRQAKVAATPTASAARKWLHKTLEGGSSYMTELQVVEGWPVRGRVVDEEGEPVPAAEVLGWCAKYNTGPADRVAKANARGEFELTHIGPDFVVTARAPGQSCRQGLRGTLSEHVLAEGLTLELTTSKSLSGLVLHPNGQPAAGAEVWISNGLSSLSSRDHTQVQGVSRFRGGRGKARTDSEGRFSIEGLTQASHRVHAKLAPYLVVYGSHPTGEGEARIVLDPGLSLDGQVLDSRGEPAMGAKVSMSPYWGNVQTSSRHTRTDEQGRFRLTGFRDDQEDRPLFAISVIHEGHALQVMNPVKPGADGGEPVLVRLDSERMIGGQVLDEEGRGLGGVEVWVEGDRELNVGATFSRRSTWESRNGLDSTTTTDEGRFRLPGLYDGEFVVHAVSPDDPQVSAEVRTRSGDEGVVLRLDRESMRKVVLRGQVLDTWARKPVTRFSVAAFIDGSARPKTFESQKGEFELAGLTPGPIQVVVSSPGFADRRFESREFDLGEHRIDAFLAPARSLRLRVMDQAGERITKGEVEIIEGDGTRVWFGSARSKSTSGRLHGEDLMLHGLPGETVTVKVSVGQGDAPEIHEFPVDLSVERSGPFEVVCKRPESEPLDGELWIMAFSRLERPDGEMVELAPVQATAQFDEKDLGGVIRGGGSFTLTDPVEILLSKGKTELGRATLTPLPNGQTRVEFAQRWDRWGGGSSASTSDNEMPFPAATFNSLPLSTVRLKVTGASWKPFEEDIDLASPGRDPKKGLFIRLCPR